MPRRTQEPRPTCPECAKVVDPKKAVPYGIARTIRNQVLEGIYDTSDCILNAIKRGYPLDRARRA
jgi:hypothetical protein